MEETNLEKYCSPFKYLGDLLKRSSTKIIAPQSCLKNKMRYKVKKLKHMDCLFLFGNINSKAKFKLGHIRLLVSYASTQSLLKNKSKNKLAKITSSSMR